MLCRCYKFMTLDLKFIVEFLQKHELPPEAKEDLLRASDAKANAVIKMRNYFQIRGVPFEEE